MRRATESVGAVIDELHVDTEIALAQQLDRHLQGVAIFARYAYEIALNGSLHLQLAVLNLFDDFAGFLGGDALLQRDLLPHRLAGGGNRLRRRRAP